MWHRKEVFPIQKHLRDILELTVEGVYRFQPTVPKLTRRSSFNPWLQRKQRLVTFLSGQEGPAKQALGALAGFVVDQILKNVLSINFCHNKVLTPRIALKRARIRFRGDAQKNWNRYGCGVRCQFFGAQLEFRPRQISENSFSPLAICVETGKLMKVVVLQDITWSKAAERQRTHPPDSVTASLLGNSHSREKTSVLTRPRHCSKIEGL